MQQMDFVSQSADQWLSSSSVQNYIARTGVSSSFRLQQTQLNEGNCIFFPSEDVSCAQSIIKDKPKEELVFGLTCRGPELEKNWMNQYVPSEMSICPG
jgi:hypothetical protein